MSKTLIYADDAIDALMDAIDDVGVLDRNDIYTVFAMLPSVHPESCIGCKWEKTSDHDECFYCSRVYVDRYEVKEGVS